MSPVTWPEECPPGQRSLATLRSSYFGWLDCLTPHVSRFPEPVKERLPAPQRRNRAETRNLTAMCLLAE